MTRLLILSCSATKIAGGPRPAIEVYDGPAYRVLRKFRDNAEPTFDELRVVILSAKYGLIRGHDKIEPYDQKMTAATARDFLTLSNIDLMRSNIGAASAGVEAVFIMGGRLYLEIMLTAVRIGHFRNASVRVADGRIGEQLRQLKSWLHEKK